MCPEFCPSDDAQWHFSWQPQELPGVQGSARWPLTVTCSVAVQCGVSAGRHLFSPAVPPVLGQAECVRDRWLSPEHLALTRAHSLGAAGLGRRAGR